MPSPRTVEQSSGWTGNRPRRTTQDAATYIWLSRDLHVIHVQLKQRKQAPTWSSRPCCSFNLESFEAKETKLLLMANFLLLFESSSGPNKRWWLFHWRSREPIKAAQFKTKTNLNFVHCQMCNKLNRPPFSGPLQALGSSLSLEWMRQSQLACPLFLLFCSSALIYPAKLALMTQLGHSQMDSWAVYRKRNK